MEQRLCIIEGTENQQLETIQALGAIIWNECYSSIISPQQIEYMLHRFQSVSAMEEQQRNGYQYYLLQQADVPIGYIGLQPAEGKMLLSKLYLLQQSRGKGYAQQAFAFVEKQGAMQQCSHIWLTVNKNNTRAIRAYQKQGFITIREQVVEIGQGFVMDDYVMEKPVPPCL